MDDHGPGVTGNRTDFDGVVLCVVFGAGTSASSFQKHVPGFIEKAEELKAKGVSEILCVSGIAPTLLYTLLFL
ncbi:Peroxiredoxin-2B [Bienertia sinuspersici]